MARGKSESKKVRRVTVSGAVPYDALADIERAVISRDQSLSAFVADAVVEAATKVNKNAEKAAA